MDRPSYSTACSLFPRSEGATCEEGSVWLYADPLKIFDLPEFGGGGPLKGSFYGSSGGADGSTSMDSSGAYPNSTPTPNPSGATAPTTTAPAPAHTYRTSMGAMLDTSRERQRRLLGADGALFSAPAAQPQQPQPTPTLNGSFAYEPSSSGIVSVVKFARPAELNAMHLSESFYQNSLRPSYSHLPTYQLPSTLFPRNAAALAPAACPGGAFELQPAFADADALRTPDSSNLAVSSLGSDLMNVSQLGFQQSADAPIALPPLASAHAAIGFNAPLQEQYVDPPPSYSDVTGGAALLMELRDGAESSFTAGEHSSEVRCDTRANLLFADEKLLVLLVLNKYMYSTFCATIPFF